MKHAGPAALDQLDAVLDRLRGLSGLREKSRGIFYRSSRAFLHFHEDPTGLYADVRLSETFERMHVTTGEEQDQLVERVRAALGDPPVA